MEKLYRLIAAAGARLGAGKVVLFGSRARGDHRERSDIDIAVYGMPQKIARCFAQSSTSCPRFWTWMWYSWTSPCLLNLRQILKGTE